MVVGTSARSGSTTTEFALVLLVLIALGFAAWQFVGLAETSFKVQQAAREAAFVAGSGLVINPERAPCWEMTGGLKEPAAFGEPEVCRTVVQNLGSLDPERVSVSVVRDDSAPNRPIFHVSVVYRADVRSPFLRLFIGPTFTATGQASSWRN